MANFHFFLNYSTLLDNDQRDEDKVDTGQPRLMSYLVDWKFFFKYAPTSFTTFKKEGPENICSKKYKKKKKTEHAAT